MSEETCDHHSIRNTSQRLCTSSYNPNSYNNNIKSTSSKRVKLSETAAESYNTSKNSNNNNNNSHLSSHEPSLASLLKILLDQQQLQQMSSNCSVAGTDTAANSCDSSHDKSYSPISSSNEECKMAPKTNNASDHGDTHHPGGNPMVIQRLQDMDTSSLSPDDRLNDGNRNVKLPALDSKMSSRVQSADDLADVVPEVVLISGSDDEEVDFSGEDNSDKHLPCALDPVMQLQKSYELQSSNSISTSKDRVKPCDDDCTQFRSGLGYSGFNLFGGGCLNVKLPTLPARDLAGEYDLLYLNYIRHHIRNGRMKFVTVEHQQTAKGKVMISAVKSIEGDVVEYRVTYDNQKMDLPFELICTDNFCFNETRRTIDQIQFNIEDNDDGTPHPYQQISEGPVWGCISVIEKPIAIGWLPAYYPHRRMVRDKTDDDEEYEESSDEEIDEDENDEILDAEFPYDRSKAFVFDSPEEAFALNEAYYDASNSWLVRQNLLPPELAMLVRTYMYPPPALVFEKGDIWFSACWNDDESEDGITWSTIARPKRLLKDDHEKVTKYEGLN